MPLSVNTNAFAQVKVNTSVQDTSKRCIVSVYNYLFVQYGDLILHSWSPIS